MIGGHLSPEAIQMISRNHVRLELQRDVVLATDVSTNGTVVRRRGSAYGPVESVQLVSGQPYPLQPWDVVELYGGVALSRADHVQARPLGPPDSSVMGDAPTISMRPL
jgi:hypothetical protein